MCYSDETCTTTCTSSRRRREAQRALGIFRRETVDGVDFQDNGLPGKFFLHSKSIIWSVEQTVSRLKKFKRKTFKI